MDYSDMDKKTLIKILKQRDETLKKLKYHIKRDYMTGVFNRREGAHILEQEINYSKTNKESFVICFVDVDRLKMINDNFGHNEGDKVLICVSTVLRKSIRKTDSVIRIGGDEFLVVFPKTTIKQAIQIWNRVCENLNTVNKLNSKYYISLSHGFYEYPQEMVEQISIESLTKKADEEMYKKKINKRRNLSIYI